MAMRAVWLTKFGEPSVLVPGDAPDPVPGPGQVLVDVAFANITFVETQFRASGFGPFNGELPMIPGNGVGGVVAALGAGADPDLLGQRIVSSTGGSGGYAERASVAADSLFVVPAGVELDTAVALLADGRTATMMAHVAGLQVGDRVLVEAAAGGVGSLLVQLAHAAGARVVAAAGGERKLAVARDLGAEFTVDYRDAGWPEKVRDTVGNLDVVFDGVGGDIGRAAHGLLEPGGRMLTYGMASGSWADLPESANVIRPSATPAELRKYTETALAGTLRPIIGQRFPLEHAADAHAAIESRATIGKTLLVP